MSAMLRPAASAGKPTIAKIAAASSQWLPSLRLHDAASQTAYATSNAAKSARNTNQTARRNVIAFPIFAPAETDGYEAWRRNQPDCPDLCRGRRCDRGVASLLHARERVARRPVGDLRGLPLAARAARDQPPHQALGTIRRRYGRRTHQAGSAA